MSGEEDFCGKVCIVTGASSGLGHATAVMFARRGAMVTLCGRDQERLDQVQLTCTQASGGQADRFITVQGDLTQHQVRQEIVDKTVKKFGKLDILVANAGVTYPGIDIKTVTEIKFDEIFNINVKSVFFLIQAALSHLEKSKGNVISTSSIGSLVASPGFCVYSMSKASLDHMTRCLALDLGPKGVRVNAVNPSFIETRITRTFSDDTDAINKAVAEREKAMQPMGEVGTPDDVAQAICFLASASAKFVTGECLVVDGGRSLTGVGARSKE